MLEEKTQSKMEKLFLAGDIPACEKLLSKELNRLPETWFHRVPAMDIDFDCAGGIARRTQPFYSRQANQYEVGMILLEFQDIRYNKKWSYSLSAWSEYGGLDSFYELTEPDAIYPVEPLFFWTRIQQGFSKRYCTREFEVAGELACYFVYMRLFSLMQVSAPQMKKVTVPLVIAPEGTRLCMEIRNGEIKTSTGEIKNQSAHDKLFEARWKEICDKVEEYIGEETPVRFSNYKRTRGGLPIDNLNDIAIPGPAVIEADTAPFWGGNESTAFQSDPVDQPTWLELCRILHDQIKLTNDEQHVFIEGIDKVGYKKIDGKRVNRYVLVLGS